MGFLDHRELKIMMGVDAAPGDPNSVEFPLLIVNLMDNASGISLAGVDGWSPKIPSIENNGIWADSPLTPGRQLISAVEGNVTETMKVIITGSSMLGVIKTLDSLYIMANNARAFWTDNSQIQPVFLKWWASCGAGPQYALVYNMTIDPVYGDSPQPTLTATLSIEREPYWRAIPPGGNPVQWRYEFYNQPYAYNSSQLGIVSNAVAQNRSELTKSGSSQTLITDNCITVPASVIPGDVPALMQWASTVNTGSTQLIVGKKTTKITQYITTSPDLFVPQNSIFNAANCTLGTDATTAADTGASNNDSAVAKRVEISFATATNQLRLTTYSPLNRANRFIGRFMVFMRCRQSAGAVGDVTMYLRYGSNITTDTDGQKLNIVSPQVIAGAGNSTTWGLSYMGIVSSPTVPGTAEVAQAGAAQAGLNSQSTISFNFALFALRSAGVGLLYINDIILIPVDEGSFTIEFAEGVSTGTIVYEETGYYTHGTPDIQARYGLPGITVRNAKLTGTGIQLSPNVENRLYFIGYDANVQSAVNLTFTVTIYLIPRWRGIRDIADIRG